MQGFIFTVTAFALAGTSAGAEETAAENLPILPGYDIISDARISIDRPGREFRIVALAKKDEVALLKSGVSPERPLLIFEKTSKGFDFKSRNDSVVLHADEGGQCDPFIDGEISVEGRFFTVENGVACGQHWTDYITFRFDDHLGFVFDNERLESWSLNTSDDPDADALVPDGPPHILRAKPGLGTLF